jgi:hypothetical protein
MGESGTLYILGVSNMVHKTINNLGADTIIIIFAKSY